MRATDVLLAARRGLGTFRAQIRTSMALAAKSMSRPPRPIDTALAGTYYFTSERGLYRIGPTDCQHILDIPAYGIALSDDWVFLALHSDVYSIVVRGDRAALREPGRSFEFREIYRLKTLSTNERIHQLYLGDEALWVANTGRNTLIKIDPETCRVVGEIPVIVDRFDRPVLFDNNHINSVSEYGGTVLFAAYRAGDGRSMIGIYDGSTVTGFGYPREGVHDIYLRECGFMFCDTFGLNTDTRGGSVVSESGAFDPNFFERPPGHIVRGLAGEPDELLIGHSHKGVRTRRFNGHGAILVARNGTVEERIDVEPAQVYQIVTDDGENLRPRWTGFETRDIIGLLCGQLGEPFYHAVVSPLPNDRGPE